MFSLLNRNLHYLTPLAFQTYSQPSDWAEYPLNNNIKKNHC